MKLPKRHYWLQGGGTSRGSSEAKEGTPAEIARDYLDLEMRVAPEQITPQYRMYYDTWEHPLSKTGKPMLSRKKIRIEHTVAYVTKEDILKGEDK